MTGAAMLLLVARAMWKWSWWRVAPLFGLFVVVEMAFLAGNVTKIPTGGWVPLTFAVLMFAMFITWRDGRQALRAELEFRAVPDRKLAALLAGKHTFIEKPMAGSTAECEELIEIARSKGLVLMTGHTFLYSPAVRKIKEAVIRTSGVPLEDAYRIENECAREVMMSEDAKEGPRAFMEKREPQYRGR